MIFLSSGLLSVIPRRPLGAACAGQAVKEVPLREATMRRRLVVTYRESGYLMPAAKLLIDYLAEAGRRAGDVKGPAGL